MNWIEKAVEEMAEQYFSVGKHSQKILKKDLAYIITKYAPVIDAEKIAKIIDKKYEEWAENEWEEYPGEDWAVPEIAKLITDSIDLDITWVDGKAEWGIFELGIWQPGNCWWWKIQAGTINNSMATLAICKEEMKSESVAQQACGKALRSIVCGVKSRT